MRQNLPKTCKYFITFGTDIQDYRDNLARYYDILRPGTCPLCDNNHPLNKHGTYNRYFCDVSTETAQLTILRYYCPKCGRTVSILPSFAIPHRQFSAALISICLQLVFACGMSFIGINMGYPSVSRVLAGTWIKSWYYSSNGVISVMRNSFCKEPQPASVCSCHRSKYITAEALEAFYLISDYVIGYEFCSCDGKCSSSVSGCENRECSYTLKGIQETFSKLPLRVSLL